MAAMVGVPRPGAGPASPGAGPPRPPGAVRSEAWLSPAADALRLALLGAGGLSTAIDTTHSPRKSRRPSALRSSLFCKENVIWRMEGLELDRVERRYIVGRKRDM